jgi:hypothetical protein
VVVGGVGGMRGECVYVKGASSERACVCVRGCSSPGGIS